MRERLDTLSALRAVSEGRKVPSKIYGVLQAKHLIRVRGHGRERCPELTDAGRARLASPPRTSREVPMSHFSVLVITAEKPTDAVLREVLAPWHEFECTGIDDAYVQDIDTTAEHRDRYATGNQAMLRAPDGTRYPAYDDRFYRDPTPEEAVAAGSFGRGRKVRVVPESYVEEDVPTREVMSFRAYVEAEIGERTVPFGEAPDTAGEHKYGYVLLTADGDIFKVIDRTNPDKKWDGWTVGGRWSGMLAAGYDPRTDPENFESCWLCGGTGIRPDAPDLPGGCNGCGGTGRKLKFASQWRGVGNVAQVRDIPVAALRDAAGREAGERYDRRVAAVAGRPIPDFAALREAHGVAKAREIYWSDPVMKALTDIGEHFLEQSDLDELRGPREAAVERGRNGALTPHAVVRDGRWFERGRMGWFAVVHDEKDPDAWDREFAAVFDALPPDAWVAVVDCHI